MTEVVLLVLTALAQEPQHGYGILEDVRRLDEGRSTLHTGTLYAVLDRLTKAGLIEVDRQEVVQSRLRRYYRLTALGVTQLAQEGERLRRRADIVSQRLAFGGGAA
jgi:DNA-binding PadR family transcriptional regulator